MNNLSLIERSRILELSQESLFEESEDASSCRDYLKTIGVYDLESFFEICF